MKKCPSVYSIQGNVHNTALYIKIDLTTLKLLTEGFVCLKVPERLRRSARDGKWHSGRKRSSSGVDGKRRKVFRDVQNFQSNRNEKQKNM